MPDATHRLLRVAGAAGVVTVGVLLLSGCTPLVVGAVGISRDRAGLPVAHLAVCQHHVDTLALLGPDASGDLKRLAEWSAHKEVTDLAVVALAASAGWDTVTPLPQLKPGVTYELAAWGDAGAWTGTVVVTEVNFTTDQLAALSPGEVRSVEGWDDTDDGAIERYGVSPQEHFTEHACDT